MPRKNLVRTDRLPYHITARANNKDTFPLPIDRMWTVFSEECLFLRMIYSVEIHAFVLMPNHIHMIATVPEYDLGIAMQEFMTSSSRTVNLFSGRCGHLFGGPYYWSLIGNTRYFGHALKYVYRNPVRGGLCESVEDYRFSSLHGLLGRSHLPFPIHLTRVGMEIALPAIEADKQLGWLNRPFPAEAEKLIKKGLRKRSFNAVSDRKTRKTSELLTQLL